ncbi:MAG: GNAT family N-acetyltransferase [Acidimicrobiales bacterium]
MEDAREAGEADVPDLARLARDAIGELAPMRGGAVWRVQEARQEPIEETFRRDLADAAARILVGTIDAVPVGYAVARIENLSDGSRLGVVEDIYVDPGAREVGLGEAMMADLVAWCTQRGCFGMDAMALPGHRSTKNFFEESGFTARKLVMYHSLRDQSAE